MAVKIVRGQNRIEEPIVMEGLEIPGLDHFVVFEKRATGTLEAELRPVDADGNAILEHPALELWIGCRISVEVRNGIPVQEDTPSGAARGAELFRGSLVWGWNAVPESQFRYRATIPLAPMKADPAPYHVIDYLIVVPDPSLMTGTDAAALMERLWDGSDFTSVTAALEAERHRLRWFLDTSWNVKAAAE